MADPLSISGSILQVMTLVGQVYDYGKQVKNAQNEICDLFGELFALKAIIEQMRKDQDVAQTLSSESVHNALQNTDSVLKQILDDLDKRRQRGQSSLKHLNWPRRKTQLQENIVQLERLKSYFILVMMNDRSATEKEMSLSIGLLKESSNQIHRNNQMELHQKIRSWICPHDLNAMHRRARSVCQAGTGLWFIEDHFQKWFSEIERSRLLYLDGKSGSGKTVLCSSVIEEAKVATENIESTEVIFSYCSFGLSATQEPTYILGAFLAQLSDKFPQMLDELIEHFQKRTLPSLETLMQLLLKHTKHLEKLFIFVDAINESTESENILSVLLNLIESAANVRVMVTSTIPPTETKDISLLRVKMQPSSNRDDIQAFIDTQLDQRPALRRLPPRTKYHIRDLLAKKANGMFRYVQCQIDLLSAQRTGRDVIRALERMPENLNGTYEIILSQISPHDRNLAREALVWLTYNQQLMTLSALCEALVLEKGDKSLDDESRFYNPNMILQICQGLIVYDEKTSIVTLAHSSVRTFLTSDAIKQSSAAFYSLDEIDATRSILQKCLTYLMFDTFQHPCNDRQPLKDRLTDFPLLLYAAENWALHCGSMAPAGFTLTYSEVDDIMTFFSTYALENGGNYTSWVQVLLFEAPPKSALTSPPLYYASSFGVLPVVDKLLEVGVSVDTYGGRNDATPLIVASYRGQMAVVKRLLDAGADVHMEDCYGMTSLEWARWRRWPEVVELLLEYGAKDVSVSRSSSLEMVTEATFLHWSCCRCGGLNNVEVAFETCHFCLHCTCNSCSF